MTERRRVIIEEALEERDEAFFGLKTENIGANGYCSFYRGIAGQLFVGSNRFA